MALNSALKSILDSSASVQGNDLVFINHFDILPQDNSVKLDVSIPSLGINLTYTMSKEDYETTMKSGFDAVSLFILKDLSTTLQTLVSTLDTSNKTNTTSLSK